VSVLPAGGAVQQAAPCGRGSDQERDEAAGASPVPPRPGPVHRLASAPAGPGAQPAGGGHRRHPQPDQQPPDHQALQRGRASCPRAMPG